MGQLVVAGDYVGGIIAGEGAFLRGGGVPSFTVRIMLGASDEATIELIAAYFGVGTTHRYARRKEHYDDEVVFQVRKLRDLVEVIVPFMDEHLPPSHKRTQYLSWRAELLDYWEHEARRRRTCTVDGCDQPQRAKGVCRTHYYQRYGR